MNKDTVVSFFDNMAHTWDSKCKLDTTKINHILDYAGISQGCTVLDVACGTGVLFPFFLDRDVKSITGVDISPCMMAQAAKKSSDKRITLITGAVEQVPLGKYDRCVIYNAFPHFNNPTGLISFLTGHLTAKGRLTIAHSESKERINHRHDHMASEVSVNLMSAYDLAKLLEPHLDVDVIIDSEEMYIISGKNSVNYK